MTAKDLIALIFKTQNPKSTEAAPAAFLAAALNKGGGPPTRPADDKRLLAPLFQKNHTLNFQLVKLQGAPTPAKTKSPSKSPAPSPATAKNAAAAPKASPARNTSATQKPSPAKKGKGNK